jgi:hypothetical protein
MNDLRRRFLLTDVSVISLSECDISVESLDIDVFCECCRIDDDTIFSMKDSPKRKRKSKVPVSSMLESVAGTKCILVLIVFDASVNKQAHSLENQVAIIDDIVQFISREVMHPLKALLGAFHGY